MKEGGERRRGKKAETERGRREVKCETDKKRRRRKSREKRGNDEKQRSAREGRIAVGEG